ncbi:MAG: trans-2-enoyl-CoA reductase family protein [Puniceicoccales bacterium]|jgi:enoyl-[acyl-carrier protein] reductase/trans-2-enoyl-CoA reductase (NAD+)|nr:trans-2-enoyl-CoA reductase family protein [Puniceicoccales bacterium]
MPTKQVVRPRIRGYICVSAHPDGCAAHVREQIECAKASPQLRDGPKSVLIIGASTGYGLASRIALAYGAHAATLGVFFEKPPENGRPASAGWYNSAAFEEQARKDGIWVKSLNGDAFGDAMKEQAIQVIKKEMPKIDLVVYSLASPRRTDPKTGLSHRSVLKPIGQTFTSKTLDTDRNRIEEITLEAATENDIADTVKVMGGEDWELWMEALDAAGVLAHGCQSVAYSYLGPQVTWPVYKNGTIGRAKQDLTRAANAIDALLKLRRGRAFVSVNKAVVTQSSSAIPVVPLYIALLFRAMKSRSIHEGCIQQVCRLFSTQVYNDNFLDFDDEGYVRMDNWELREDVQKEVFDLWPRITTENMNELTDYVGYQKEFLKLFGFGLPDIDYEAPTELDAPIAGL